MSVRQKKPWQPDILKSCLNQTIRFVFTFYNIVIRLLAIFPLKKRINRRTLLFQIWVLDKSMMRPRDCTWIGRSVNARKYDSSLQLKLY